MVCISVCVLYIQFTANLFKSGTQNITWKVLLHAIRDDKRICSKKREKDLISLGFWKNDYQPNVLEMFIVYRSNLQQEENVIIFFVIQMSELVSYLWSHCECIYE